MRIKFLLVLAVLCLSVHFTSANGSAEKKDSKMAVKVTDAKKSDSKKVATEVKVVKVKKSVEETHEKTKKTEVKKEIRKKAPKLIPCSERIAKDKEDCEKSPAGYKGIFKYKENADCDWECNYEALPTLTPPKKEKKTAIVMKTKEKVAKTEKKECSGEQKILFSNCLVKIKGLIAWGDKVRNFDKRFERLTNDKKKKSPKKVKAAKKAGGKKNAQKNNKAKKAAKKAAKKPPAPKA